MVSKGKSIVSAVPKLLPSWSLSCAVTTYVVVFIDKSIEAAYLVELGNADTSAAVVGTVMFIVLAVDWFAVKLSTNVPFFCIDIVALFTVGMVGKSVISALT